MLRTLLTIILKVSFNILHNITNKNRVMMSKCFASLFYCIRFSHVRREGLLYSHSKRNDNEVAYSLTKNALCIPYFQV